VWGPVRLVIESEEKSAHVDLLRVRFTHSDGRTKEINATERPTDAAPLLGLISKKIAAAASTDGVLVLRFDDGSEIRAEPDDRYESWSVVGDGKTIQCLPGGELDSW
jgi:hypothetical protein